MKLSLPGFSAVASRPVDGMAQRSKMMEYDQPLVWVVVLLMLFGMVMVYSASISLPDSPKYASYKNGHFLLRQAVYIGMSLVMGYLAFKVPINDSDMSRKVDSLARA